MASSTDRGAPGPAASCVDAAADLLVSGGAAAVTVEAVSVRGRADHLYRNFPRRTL